MDNVAEYLFHEGTNYHSHDFLGSFLSEDGCTFRVWAPNAKKVYVTGEFCDWKPKIHEMKRISSKGIYEIKLQNIKQYDSYKYFIVTSSGKELWKADPYARHSETRPETASKVYKDFSYEWHDEKWMKKRTIPYTEPMNIYEVHLGSWKHDEIGNELSYQVLAEELVSYVKEMNYTHIELMPITEYPYDKSWGYQVTGYFAPTSRYGIPEDFMYFVDKCHQNNIGVILDWVPGHFTKDEHGLYEFDGTQCYEYSDVRKMEHDGWGTRVFDYGKNEVRSFLISSAVYWLDNFHVDGLRVDAVSSMIFLNYCRDDDESARNIYGGFENLEAIDFLKTLNNYVREYYPSVMMIAEESTSYPKITVPVEHGGLGFNFKWNMGWMNDSLNYLEIDPFFRNGSHDKFTFSMYYAFSENFILPLSHDEVVHGKKSLLDKSPVAYDDKFNNFRAFLGYMFAHPGKKLTFMGIDIAQFIEWDEVRELDWLLMLYPKHVTTHRYVKELNKYYRQTPAFWQNDGDWSGFKWHIVDDKQNEVFVFSRKDNNGKEVLVVSNFSGQILKGYEVGVDAWGSYKVVLNSDAKKYDGSGLQNRNLKTIKKEKNNFKYTLSINIPPYATLYIEKKY
ncbi:1,4-alpha-glucan branching enzyme [Gemella bergeri ATCC 700627]|uniref:1,4-alpha-glucan branching enzyme GlgB n=1 Tax=Gemella bergeri ATCC 700627 TaxID=1321820 RepID=U2QR45_9BACL|nr:1,4-alpha-glucan branching protein GlgB [Gemella bergeri]ERK58976.1 1,4-alpha-glucan branching enzyme [Gemella bergeri ATCC 700627]